MSRGTAAFLLLCARPYAASSDRTGLCVQNDATPLKVASEANQLTVVKTLLEHGADINTANAVSIWVTYYICFKLNLFRALLSLACSCSVCACLSVFASL